MNNAKPTNGLSPLVGAAPEPSGRRGGVAFAPASKRQARLRLALIGPSGSGKTWTALRIASGLGSKIALIDTERGSASKYADLHCPFDVLELAGDFHPSRYIEAIQAAVKARYDVLIIDSLSHAWAGAGGVLEQVDRITRRSNSQNKFTAWADVTPLQNALVDTMLQSDLHLIVTLRVKTEYVLSADDKGKMVPKKVGLAPIQREGLDYEFDVIADMDLENTLSISKTRCPALNGAVISQPKDEIATALLAWLSDGVAAPGQYVSDFDEDLRDRACAERFVNDWAAREVGTQELLDVLRVERLSQWTKVRKAADEKVEQYIEEMSR